MIFGNPLQNSSSWKTLLKLACNPSNVPKLFIIENGGAGDVGLFFLRQFRLERSTGPKLFPSPPDRSRLNRRLSQQTIVS
jgi:hypothetical protein